MADSEFVRVSNDRTHFTLGDKPFYFCGANCYYLLTRAADPGLVHEVTGVLNSIAASGLTVVRTWAFNDGASQWNALQTQPGEFAESVFRALDFVVAEAGKRGLKLLLDLTNYWQDYGGMLQYVTWSRQQQGLPEEGCRPEEFYTDGACQEMFRIFVTTILLRAAHFVKQVDPNHLVTLDCEGFLGPSTPGSQCCNPYDCNFTGCDFLHDSHSPHIDFACCHLYPDLWLPKAAEEAKLRFALSWLDVHTQLAGKLGKPLVLSEFGKKAGEDPGSRAGYFDTVLGRVLKLMQDGSPMAGSIFWMTAAPSYPEYDGFTIYLPATPAVTQGGVLQGLQIPHGCTTEIEQPQTGPKGVKEREAAIAGEQQSRLGGLLKCLMRKLSIGRGPGGTMAVSRAEVQASADVAESCPTQDTASIILAHAAQVAELNRQSSFAAS
ncbi:hypothetical protein N2152v2_004286 [Parachlorella kessleri]